MSLRKGNNDLFLLFLERGSKRSRYLMHCRSAVSNTTTHEAVSVDILPTIHVESEIEYRPPSIIGRVYKICALLGQLLLAPKCSPKSQNLVEK